MSIHGEPTVKTICLESTQKCFTFFIYFRKVQLNLLRPGSTYGSHLTISLIFFLFIEWNVLYFNSTVSILSLCCIILHIWFNGKVSIQPRCSILKPKAPFPAGIPNWRLTGEDLRTTYKTNNILFKAFQYSYACMVMSNILTKCVHQISWRSVYILSGHLIIFDGIEKYKQLIFW